MMSYFIGTIFIICYILFMLLIGTAFFPKKSFSYQFILGYLIFSFFVAIIGIPIQLLNLSWKVFAVYLGVVFISLFFYSFFKIKKDKIVFFSKNKILDYLKSQSFLIIVSAILVVISILNIKELWLGNCMDDGFYISWVSSLPYNENFFLTNPATGFSVNFSNLFTYLLNTIYSEYAVYSYYLGIAPTVLCRVFMNFFNYYLCASSICYITEYLMKHTSFSISKNYFQFTSIVLLLFGLNHYFMVDKEILNVYDGWQFNTAMYYGSSLVRTVGIFLIIIPFLEIKKIGIKEVLCVCAIAIALVSKSSIVFPVIIIVAISYLITHLLFQADDRRFFYLFGIIASLVIVSIFMGNDEAIQNLSVCRLHENLDSPLILICVISFMSSFFLKCKAINKINIFLIVVFLFIILEPINNIFEITSFFGFVAERMVTSLIYSFIILSIIYLFIYMYKILKTSLLKNVFIVLLTILIQFILLYSYGLNISNIMQKSYVIYKNKNIFPSSSIQLGEVLEDKYYKTEEINNVIMNEGVIANGYVHSIGTSLRTISPHSKSLAAIPRYGEDNRGEFKGMSKDVQSKFEYFTNNPSFDTYQEFSESMEGYPINTIIARSSGLDQYFLQDGFVLYDTVFDVYANVSYYIYVR